MVDLIWSSSLKEAKASKMVEWVCGYPTLYNEFQASLNYKLRPLLSAKKMILKVTKSKVKSEN